MLRNSTICKLNLPKLDCGLDQSPTVMVGETEQTIYRNRGITKLGFGRDQQEILQSKFETIPTVLIIQKNKALQISFNFTIFPVTLFIEGHNWKYIKLFYSISKYEYHLKGCN